MAINLTDLMDIAIISTFSVPTPAAVDLLPGASGPPAQAVRIAAIKTGFFHRAIPPVCFLFWDSLIY
jgi:hypothetical protein